MIEKPLTEVKKADLDAELALYVEAGVEDVATFTANAKNSDRIAEIERLRGIHGHPMKIDEAFIAENPELVAVVEASGDTLTAGELVFFSDADLASAEEQKRLNEPTKYVVTQEHLDTNEAFAAVAKKAGIKVGDELPYDPAVVISREAAIEAGIDVEAVEAAFAATKPVKTPVAKAPTVEAATTGTEPDLVYQRKTVIRTENVIANGKMYKDVTVATGETFRITPAEFESEVKPRA